MKVDDIFYENGYYWVWKDKTVYHVMVAGNVASISESSYNDSSVAVARADYLAKTHTAHLNETRYNKLYKAYQNEMQEDN